MLSLTWLMNPGTNVSISGVGVHLRWQVSFLGDFDRMYPDVGREGLDLDNKFTVLLLEREVARSSRW